MCTVNVKGALERLTQQLTGGLVAVGLGGDVVLGMPLLGPRNLLHLPDLGHAKLGVVVEEHAAAHDG